MEAAATGPPPQVASAQLSTAHLPSVRGALSCREEVSRIVHARRRHGRVPWPGVYDTACRKAASQVESTSRYDRHDAYQAAAERLWNDRPDPTDERLCYVIARRGIIDWLRIIGDIRRGGKSLKRVPVDDGVQTGWENGGPTPVVPDHADTVVRDLEQERRHQWLWRRIPHLPRRQQQVVRLHLQGRTTREIGRALGMREQTVWAHMHHARRRLRDDA